MTGPEMSHRRFVFLASSIGVLALLLREQFVLLAQPESPISGDIRQYVAYALNLIQQGVFSSAMPGSAVIAPDTFRGPGYPLFLAACMKVRGAESEAWYYLALHLQSFFGAATVVMGTFLGRKWLPAGAALASGLLMAVWPHHIAATGALLSEVLFGFMLMLAMLLTARSLKASGFGSATLAGAAFGYAYLINPIILIFPVAILFIFWRSGHARKGACLLAVTLLFASVWSIRNSTVPAQIGPGRAEINLVQGSWPLYHSAWIERLADPVAQQMIAESEAEALQLSNNPVDGFKRIAARMGEAPAAYAHWYLIEKPYLLWDWDIRVGAGDIYFLAEQNSPFETNALLHQVKLLLKTLNPVFFLLATVGALVIVFRWCTGRTIETTAVLVALFCLYVTAIHNVFQAEPRYASPYRPFELLLAMGTAVWVVAWLKSRIRPAKAAAPFVP